MTLPDLSDSERIALFLDFDGTPVAIADRPDEVQLDLSTRKVLIRLDTAHLDFAAASKRKPKGRWC